MINRQLEDRIHKLRYCKLVFLYPIDVNECRESTTPCDQLCENTEGSYKCACQPGFKLDPDGVTCVGESNTKLIHWHRELIHWHRKEKY